MTVFNTILGAHQVVGYKLIVCIYKCIHANPLT
jgi:hypothetical protein